MNHKRSEEQYGIFGKKKNKKMKRYMHAGSYCWFMWWTSLRRSQMSRWTYS